jgi:hypothetical protein
MTPRVGNRWHDAFVSTVEREYEPLEILLYIYVPWLIPGEDQFSP